MSAAETNMQNDALAQQQAAAMSAQGGQGFNAPRAFTLAITPDQLLFGWTFAYPFLQKRAAATTPLWDDQLLATANMLMQSEMARALILKILNREKPVAALQFEAPANLRVQARSFAAHFDFFEGYMRDTLSAFGEQAATSGGGFGAHAPDAGCPHNTDCVCDAATAREEWQKPEYAEYVQAMTTAYNESLLTPTHGTVFANTPADALADLHADETQHTSVPQGGDTVLEQQAEVQAQQATMLQGGVPAATLNAGAYDPNVNAAPAQQQPLTPQHAPVTHGEVQQSAQYQPVATQHVPTQHVPPQHGA